VTGPERTPTDNATATVACAEELTDFNCHIVGQIRVVAEFPGEAA
jgi:hypothetical protein